MPPVLKHYGAGSAGVSRGRAAMTGEACLAPTKILVSPTADHGLLVFLTIIQKSHMTLFFIKASDEIDRVLLLFPYILIYSPHLHTPL